MPTLVSTGEITIADLNDAVQLLLSLPTVALPANAAGTVSSFATAVSTARVMQGGANVTASWTLSKSDSNCTSTLASGVVTVSALSADAGSVTVTATRAGWPTLTAVFALSKAKQGATGATGSTGAAGATGSTGAAGAAGADAFTLLLSSEAWQLPADSGGNVTSYTGAVTTAKVLKGTTDDTSNWTFTRLASSANITSTASGTPAGSIVTITAMAAASAVEYVDITATKSGAPTLTKRFNVTKAKQGAAGAPGSTGATGSTGPRGTVELARAIATSVWSDSEAASALSGAGYGTAVSGDVVTLYNTSTKWAESRVYSGTWQTLAAHINGALLVDESVVARKIDTRGLSIKDAAGNVILAAGTALGYLDAAGALRLAGDAVAYTDPRNLVDASSWVPGSAFPWSGLNTVAAENSVISGVGPNGATMALLKGLSNGDSATAGNWDGGYYNDGPLNTYRAIDTSKRYRVIVPFKRLDSSPSGTSRFYMGASPGFPGAGLERLYGQNGTSLISNPYFVSRLVSELPLNVWLYAVGYVYPLGSTNVALADTGIYVASTGEPVAGNNGAATFVWHSNAATLGSGLRAGQYDCKTVGEEMHFAPPFIHVVDGSEPKHTELFRPSSILNENISINADGTLSGGGAGQVTITGLGYTGDMNATSDLTLVADIGCTVAGNTITSTHTSSGFGNCAAHSREGFANGAYLSFVVNDLGKSFLAGLNDAPASSNTYTDMEFCWYLDASGNARVRTGANIAVDLYTTTVAVGDVLLIQYDGGACYFLKNGVLMYTATGVTPGRTYFADFSLYHVGTTVAGIKFGPLGNNAWGALAGIPYETIFNNDDSVALGFNPTFNWPSGNYPVNWLNWAGGVPTKETSIVRVGTAAVRYAASGANIGMQRQVSFAASPLPVGTFLAGSVDMYLVAFTSGKPLIVVDLFTDSALTAYTRREVPIPVASAGAVGAWQRVPWTARVGAAQQIYGVRIYVMGCWTSAVTGAFTGTVIFDNLRFMLADSTVDNKALTLSEAGGVISIPGSGGGTVTAVTPNNKINTGNVSTYLGAAAITNAYIGKFISSDNFDGAVNASGAITANGNNGWAIGKSGKAVLQDVYVRGSGKFAGDITGSNGTFSGVLAAGVVDFTAATGSRFEYSTPGTYSVYTLPWVGKVRFTLIGGGGGGGGGGQGVTGRGGSAGASLVAVEVNNVPQGTTVSVTVGSGGAGAPTTATPTTPGSGSAGTATSITIPGMGTWSAAGGAGGGYGSSGVPNEQAVWYFCADPDDFGALVTSAGTAVAYGASRGGDRGAAALGQNVGFLAAQAAPTLLDGGAGAWGGGGGGGAPSCLWVPNRGFYVDPVDGEGGNGNPTTRGGAGGAGFALVEIFNPNSVVLRSEYDTYVNTRKHESAWTSGLPSPSAVIGIATGIATQAKFASFIAECTTADAGYGVGDQVLPYSANAGWGAYPTFLLWGGMTVLMNQNNWWYVTPRNGGQAVAMTTANWKWKVVSFY